MRAGRPRLLPIECDNTRTNGIGTKEWVVRNSHPILDLVRQKMELLVEEVPVCRCFRGTITRAHSTTERIVGGSVGRLAGQYCWAEWSAFQQSRTRTEPSVSTGKKKKRSNPTHDTCIVFLANSITQIQNHQPKIFILANVYYPHWHIVMWCRRYSMDTLYLYSWIVFYDVDLYMCYSIIFVVFHLLLWFDQFRGYWNGDLRFFFCVLVFNEDDNSILKHVWIRRSARIDGFGDRVGPFGDNGMPWNCSIRTYRF